MLRVFFFEFYISQLIHFSAVFQTVLLVYAAHATEWNKKNGIFLYSLSRFTSPRYQRVKMTSFTPVILSARIFSTEILVRISVSVLWRSNLGVRVTSNDPFIPTYPEDREQRVKNAARCLFRVRYMRIGVAQWCRFTKSWPKFNFPSTKWSFSGTVNLYTYQCI